MKHVVIIIPTYNESLVISQTIHQVFRALLDAPVVPHILIFDSSSTDDTQDIVHSLQSTYPRLHLQTEPHKTGLGSAYLQAMRFALMHLKADVVVEFDADLSHQPQYLVPILEQLQHCDVVVGSRYVSGGSIPADWGWHRKCLSRLGNFVARMMLTPKYHDFTSGFRATCCLALNKALPNQFISNHYAYKLELFWNLHKTKAKIKEYPIEFVDRNSGESKLPANSVVDSLRVLALLRLKELKSYISMCAVGLVGLLIHFLVYNTLRLKCSPLLAIQISVTAAVINNFLLNNRFTFKKRNANQGLRAFVLFLGYSLLMLGFQTQWLRLGIHLFGLGWLKENMIVATGVAVASVLNYLVYSRWIWPKRKSPMMLQ